MDTSVRDFLGCSYNHGDYITIKNNLELNETLWEGKFETIEHDIPSDIAKLPVHKWGIQNNSIVIYVNYKKVNIEDIIL